MEFSVHEERPDPATFNSLRKCVGWEEHRVEDIETALRNTLYCVVARDAGGRTIGMARVIGDEGLYYYIQDVIVAPEFQGRGIGKAMMEKVLAFIARNRKAGLFVGLMAAKGKEGFYGKLGFAERPSERYGPGMCMSFD